MHELKIYRGVICKDTEEWWKIWRGIDLPFQNWHKEFDVFWLENLKISKIYTLMGCLWPKYIMFELKKYRGVISHDTREWRKFEENWLVVWKTTWGIWQISPEHMKVSKLVLLLGLFIQIRKCMSLKFREELYVMTMKNDANFEKELTCQFKIDIKKFNKFWPKHSKVSQICTLMGCFWPKFMMFELRKSRGVMFHGTQGW